MIPQVKEVDIRKLSYHQQRKICECEDVCQKAVTLTTYNDGMMLCWNNARKFMYNLINELGANSYTTWMEDDEQYIINFYKEHGNYYGIIPDIAKALCKSHSVTKAKISRMKKKGLIP